MIQISQLKHFHVTYQSSVAGAYFDTFDLASRLLTEFAYFEYCFEMLNHQTDRARVEMEQKDNAQPKRSRIALIVQSSMENQVLLKYSTKWTFCKSL